jgi:tetratricopeptide (TPR) repeat protein
MMRTLRMLVLILAAAGCGLGTVGCASTVERWIVDTRNHQGDLALEHGNDADASVAYQLALRVDPTNAHAKAGLVSVQRRLAFVLFSTSKFEEAVAALQIAARYAPGDERIGALQNQIEQAEIKRDIVVSNYPAYRETGSSIRRQVDGLGPASKRISTTLRRFDYTYDSNELTDALRQTYELADEVRRITGRLLRYRQLVDSGVPENAPASANVEPPGSLLPLP